MDIVYFIDSRKESKVLRYSLRSLRFVKHNRVFIIGKAPSYIKGVEVIEYTDTNRSCALNIKNKYQLILESDISEDFILFNDDFYLTQDTDIPYYYSAKLKDLIDPKKRDDFTAPIWQSRIDKLLKAFPNGNFYEVHAPIIFNKTKLGKIIQKLADRDYHAIRSWYCNTYKVKSTFTFDHKLYDKSHQMLRNPSAPIPPFISSDDSIESDSGFLRLMRRLYPDPSPYENALKISVAPPKRMLPIIDNPATQDTSTHRSSNRSLKGFKKKSHIVLTRLHYRDNDPMFDARLATYRVLTLPRLLDQEDKDFDIGVICNPAHAKIIENIHPRVQAITTTKFGTKNKKGYYSHSIHFKDIKGMKKYDIQTSIDSDDLVSPQFTAIIQEEIFRATRERDISTHIHFNLNLFNLKTLEEQPIKRRYSNQLGSAFYSLYQPDKKNYIFINQVEHTRMPLLATQSIFIKDIHCHATIHDWNDSTSINHFLKAI